MSSTADIVIDACLAAVAGIVVLNIFSGAFTPVMAGAAFGISYFNGRRHERSITRRAMTEDSPPLASHLPKTRRRPR